MENVRPLTSYLNFLPMFNNYFKLAYRNIFKQKLLSLINILGLSLGLACFCLFLLYAVNELNYDRFHANSDSIFRVYRWSFPAPGEKGDGDVYMPMPLGPAMKQDIADVSKFARLRDFGSSFVRLDEQVLQVPVVFADPDFFNMFSFKLTSGQPLKALHEVVLSKPTVSKLFGVINPVGKTIEIKIEEQFETFTITGVTEDIPSNSSINFGIVANYEHFIASKNGARSVNNWNRSSYITFVQLQPESTLHLEPKRLQAFYTKYHPNEEKDDRQRGRWNGEGPPTTYGLQPLKAMHTDVTIWGGSAVTDPKKIWILLGIAGVLLLIACINFTTLAIGRSAGRAREVGIRKVMGSKKTSLMMQFIVEAILLSFLSTGIGLVLGKLLLPLFNQLASANLEFSFSQFPELTWMILGLTLLVGLLAGSYPTLVLSKFNPIEVLRQKIKVGGSNLFTRSLVTLQFSISIGLIASTLIILQQVKYMSSAYPGFTKENIVVVNADDTDTKKIYPLFKQASLKNINVLGMASAELGLGAGAGWSRSGFEYEGKHKNVYEYFIDPDYIPLMNVPLLAGRNFDRTIAADTQTSVIINEAMVLDFGWTIDNAVGQVLKGYNQSPDAPQPVVIGVIKNFNYRSMKEEVKPQLFHQFHDYAPYKFFVKIQAGNPTQTLADLKDAWSTVVPELPFRYSFLDEDLDRFYQAEVRWGKIVGWAGGISIFLACLGLFGLTTLATINRIKEIGIRKILGASMSNIVGLLSKDFIRLILISFVIASPLAAYFMNMWLRGFAHRISLSGWIFILAGVGTLMIAILTISVQSIRTTSSNPVKSLRTE